MICVLEFEAKKKKVYSFGQFKSNKITFIYIELFTIQIVSKQLHSDNMKIIQHRSIIFLIINGPN